MDKNSQINYTTINHVARRKLGLTWIEYGLIDLVHNLSNNPDSSSRWCYASKIKLGEMLGVTEQYVHKIINKAIQLGLLEKHSESKHLRTTNLWFETVIIDTKQSLATLNKVYPDTKQSLAEDTKQSLDNKDIYNKDNNNLTTIVVSEKSLDEKKEEFGNPEINSLCTVFTQAFDTIPNLKKQRQAAFSLIRNKQIGFDKALAGAKYAIGIQGEEFAPRICSPLDLLNKWGDLVVYGRKKAKTIPRAVNISQIIKQREEERFNVTENT